MTIEDWIGRDDLIIQIEVGDSDIERPIGELFATPGGIAWADAGWPEATSVQPFHLLEGEVKPAMNGGEGFVVLPRGWVRPVPPMHWLAPSLRIWRAWRETEEGTIHDRTLCAQLMRDQGFSVHE